MVKPQKPRRAYPPFWEKFIPFFLVLITLIVLVLIAVAITVVLGIFPAA